MSILQSKGNLKVRLNRENERSFKLLIEHRKRSSNINRNNLGRFMKKKETHEEKQSNVKNLLTMSFLEFKETFEELLKDRRNECFSTLGL